METSYNVSILSLAECFRFFLFFFLRPASAPFCSGGYEVPTPILSSVNVLPTPYHSTLSSHLRKSATNAKFDTIKVGAVKGAVSSTTPNRWFTIVWLTYAMLARYRRLRNAHVSRGFPEVDGAAVLLSKFTFLITSSSHYWNYFEDGGWGGDAQNAVKNNEECVSVCVFHSPAVSC